MHRQRTNIQVLDAAAIACPCKAPVIAPVDTLPRTSVHHVGIRSSDLDRVGTAVQGALPTLPPLALVNTPLRVAASTRRGPARATVISTTSVCWPVSRNNWRQPWPPSVDLYTPCLVPT